MCDQFSVGFFSGVECKDEIYASHQLASVKSEAASPEPKTSADVREELVDNSEKVVENVKPATPTRSRPISVTAKLFSSYEPPKEPEVTVRPHTATKTIFAPRTKDMSKGFLTFSEEEPGLTSKYNIFLSLLFKHV